MEETLENDNVVFKWDNIDRSKLPLTKRDNVGEGIEGQIFYPYTPVEDLKNGVVYFMCQATGYKLVSNQEIPCRSSDNIKWLLFYFSGNVSGEKDTANGF